ncbi:hypothetical protein SEVIR_9G065866v4 [Setaria viridis]
MLASPSWRLGGAPRRHPVPTRNQAPTAAAVAADRPAVLAASGCATSRPSITPLPPSPSPKSLGELTHCHRRDRPIPAVSRPEPRVPPLYLPIPPPDLPVPPPDLRSPWWDQPLGRLLPRWVAMVTAAPPNRGVELPSATGGRADACAGAVVDYRWPR